MDILTLSLTIILSLVAIHIAAFFAIRTMYPPSPKIVSFIQPAVIEQQHVVPTEPPIPIETISEKAVVSVPVIPSEDAPVQRDTGVDIPHAE